MAYSKHQYREKYKEIFENPHYYIFIYNLDGIILDVNDLIMQNFGYSYHEIVNKEFKDFINKDDFAKLTEEISKIREIDKSSVYNIYKIKQKDGEYREILIMNIPLRDNNEIYAMMAIGAYITNFKDGEKKLKDSEEKFRLIEDNVIKFVNEAMLNILELQEQDLINQDPLKFIKIIHPSDRSTILKRFQDIYDKKCEMTKPLIYRINTISGQMG